MLRIRLATDLAECQALWERSIPRATLTDLWEVRACFQRHFRRPPCFVVAEDAAGPCGLLPLSWIDEAGCYGCFPGETWAGKTWLEQNRIVARDPGVLARMLDAVPGPYHLRYLLPGGGVSRAAAVDEIGYLFLPPSHGCDLERYFGAFGHKFAKKLRKELARFNAMGLAWRHDDLDDFDGMVRLNVERFGETSYFADERFRESFRDLMHLAHVRGWLRMTAVLVGGEAGAIDMGCIYRGAYTLVAGGTHGDYKGIAKVINIHHMAWACEQRLAEVDFLCGDFGWKPLFRLTPRPLHLLSNVAPVADEPIAAEVTEAVGVR